MAVRATTLCRLLPGDDGYLVWALGKLRLWNFIQWFLAEVQPDETDGASLGRFEAIVHWANGIFPPGMDVARP